MNGVRSRVGFKATGANGLGMSVKGIILDSENKEIDKFETAYRGMGYFHLKPEEGKTYQAKITYSDGSVNVLKLPEAAKSGYTLSVYNNAATDTILVRIGASSSAFESGSQFVSLVAQTNGDIQYAVNIPISKSISSVLIPAKNIQSGILQFTLFSKFGDPLNERIVFIQNNDQMDLKLSCAKTEYSLREKVEVGVEAKDAGGKHLNGNFSISVINEDVVPSDEDDENSIYAQFLLSSDIRGYIEKPNYYFHNPTDETRTNLDLLMLTQGYRRFVWKDLLLAKQILPTYSAEKLVTNITGKLMSLGNKTIANGKVTLINNKIGLILDTLTDNNGKFKFSNLLITEGIDFTIQGRTNKNGKKLEILIDKIQPLDMTPNKNIGDINPDIPKLLKASIENNTKQDLDLQKHGYLGRGSN
ncbi:carboxypeptidase-like regulatory domain-containing protein [Pedobacter steynii]